jgi:hypothetical protein
MSSFSTLKIKLGSYFVELRSGASTTDGPAELLESLPERRGAELSFRIVLGVRHQHADTPFGLLRTRY